MSSERYVGERRALWHFLSELQPLVVEALGEDSLLRHHIRRAMKSGDLEMLRQARRIFHNHPDQLKRQLMRGLFEGTATGAELPTALPGEGASLSPDVVDQPSGSAQVVRFDAVPAVAEEDAALSVDLDTQQGDGAR